MPTQPFRARSSTPRDNQRYTYRGLDEWDGAGRAEFSARALWRVLALVSVPGSIGYVLLDGRHRDDLLPPVTGSTTPTTPPPPAEGRWWCPVAVA